MSGNRSARARSSAKGQRVAVLDGPGVAVDLRASDVRLSPSGLAPRVFNPLTPNADEQFTSQVHPDS